MATTAVPRWIGGARAAVSALLVVLLVPQAGRAQTAAAGGFVPGSREIYSIDFSKSALGDPPKEIIPVAGRSAGQVVDKDGVRMFRATELSEFLVRLKEPLPEAFTLEFDVIPKAGGAPEDISFEGTATISRSASSAHVTINSTAIFVVGGKPDDANTFWMAMPTELAEIMPNTMTHFGVSVDAKGIDIYANNRLITSLGGTRFAHGQVLRVGIGGNDDGPAYLGRLRIGAGGTPPTLAGNNSGPSWQTPVSSNTSSSTSTTAGSSPNTQTEPRSGFQVTVTMGSAGPLVSWPVVPNASGYSVSRQKIGDICCNNDSGRGYLAGSPWQDKPLPSSGTYSYLVLANTPAGLVRAETQFSYTAPAPVNAVLASPMTTATGMVTTTSSGTTGGGSSVIGGTTTTQRSVTDLTAASDTSGRTGGSGDVPAKYRVTLTGFRATTPTREPILLEDGRFDEAYAAAAVVLFNRKDSTVLSHTVARTREYGDVGGGKFGDRIQAGTATSSGGIGGLGAEHVPNEFDPSGSTFPPATSDRFPLLLWEGALNSGAEALLIVPTVWDRDLDSTTYVAWKTPWITSSLKTLVTSNEVVNETKTAGVVQIVSDQHPGFPFVLPMSEAEGHVKDRPIGAQLDPPQPLPPVAIIYKDRHVMLTQEKLADLGPGASKIIPLPFGESGLSTAVVRSVALGALYTLYIRIERIQ